MSTSTIVVVHTHTQRNEKKGMVLISVNRSLLIKHLFGASIVINLSWVIIMCHCLLLSNGLSLWILWNFLYLVPLFQYNIFSTCSI